MKKMMKKTLTIMLVVSLVLAMTSACNGGGSGGGGGGNSPSAAVRAYYAALEKGDVEALEKVTTPGMAQLLVGFEDFVKALLAEQGKITNIVEKIDSDTAVVTVTFENGKTEDAKLIKEGGKWKVTN